MAGVGPFYMDSSIWQLDYLLTVNPWENKDTLKKKSSNKQYNLNEIA